MSRTKEQTSNLEMVAFTEDLTEARQFRALLKENSIFSQIRRKTVSADITGFGLFVNEEDVDESHVILESHSAYSDFYEIAFDEAQNRNIDESDYDF